MKSTFGTIFAVLVIVSSSPSCVPYRPLNKLSSKPLSVQLDAVNGQDGINEEEATTLADIYYLSARGFCGGIDRIKRRKGVWQIRTFDGPRGTSGNPIVVDVETGAISQEGERTVSPPWNEFREVLRATGN